MAIVCYFGSFLDSLEQLERLFLMHSTGDLLDSLWFFGGILSPHGITALKLYVHTNTHIHIDTLYNLR